MLRQKITPKRENKMDNGEAKTNNPVKIHRPNNVIAVPVSSDLEFFRNWCIFLRPFVDITEREIDVFSELLRRRNELSKAISDPVVLDKVLMSEAMKHEMMKACNMSQKHFYVVMSSLKKKNVISDGNINQRLIPNIRETDNGVFQLMVLFKRNDVQRDNKESSQTAGDERN